MRTNKHGFTKYTLGDKFIAWWPTVLLVVAIVLLVIVCNMGNVG